MPERGVKRSYGQGRRKRLPTVRLTEGELAQVEADAKTAGMEIAEYVRHRLFYVDTGEDEDDEPLDWGWDRGS